MHRDRPVGHVMTDDERETNDLAVVAAYRAAMAVLRTDEKVFDAAVQAWRELYPDASGQLARPAVADILSHKL